MRRLPIALAMLGSSLLSGQQPLALQDAVRRALDQNPTIEAAEAGQKQAEQGIAQAKSGYLPRVNYSESYQRSNNPVFVFSSLLSQNEFTEQNFEVESLNQPDALNNFQSRLIIEQTLFDSHRTRREIEAARLRTDLAGAAKQGNDAQVALSVVRGYWGVVLASEKLGVTAQAVKSAEADRGRAQAMFDAGMTTPADVMAVEVHLAEMREDHIRAENDLATARMALNHAMGASLEARFDPTTPLAPLPLPPGNAEPFEKLALSERPELRQAGIAKGLAAAQIGLARTGYWPQVVAQGVIEADRQQFLRKAGGNWLAGVSLRWNLFNGSETKSRVAAARFGQQRAEALERDAQSGVRLQVRQAYLQLKSASERVSVSQEAVAQAESSHGIVRNRYEAGLTTVTELLRSDTALIGVRLRRLAAIHDQRIAAANLEYAAGTLGPESEVLR